MNRVKSIMLMLTFCISLAQACTVFVLTDEDDTLFCNNEDWSDPNTRLWFIPGDEDHYGCALVGFDDGWGQGGFNTQGLAYDWVAGYIEPYEPDPELKTVQGNPSERMLASCATVEEAVTFFKTYHVPSVSYARILIVDATGTSAVIGAKDGKLDITLKHQSHGYGFGDEQLNVMLPDTSAPTLANGMTLLRACKQPGKTSTKYANIFNVTTKDIILLPRPDLQTQVKLNLTSELSKGGHYYDLPRIEEQLKLAPKALLDCMKR